MVERLVHFIGGLSFFCWKNSHHAFVRFVTAPYNITLFLQDADRSGKGACCDILRKRDFGSSIFVVLRCLTDRFDNVHFTNRKIFEFLCFQAGFFRSQNLVKYLYQKVIDRRILFTQCFSPVFYKMPGITQQAGSPSFILTACSFFCNISQSHATGASVGSYHRTHFHHFSVCALNTLVQGFLHHCAELRYG